MLGGGRSDWSFGGGMQWLTGHWEWHAIASYVVVPLDAEPTLVFSMGGTHAEACRRECANALSDVRHSRGGRYAEVIVERLNELKLERGRIGLLEVDARHSDYLPIGSTPMADPAMVFGNPRPSQRKLQTGDIINMELAAGYNGLSAQIGSPITLGPPPDMVRKFWDEITLPGYRKIVAEIKPGNATDNMRLASRFFREHCVQSRPTQGHGIH